MSRPFFSLSGLREVAIYLDHLFDSYEESQLEQFRSQNYFASLVGVSPTTITSFRRNRNLSEADFTADTYHKPKFDLILAMAPFLPDPMTGKPFDPDGKPCRLEAVLRGWEPLYPPQTTENRAILVIRTTYARDKKAFLRAGMTTDSVGRLLEGEPPTTEELLQLQEALKMPLEQVVRLFPRQQQLRSRSPQQNGKG